MWSRAGFYPHPFQQKLQINEHSKSTHETSKFLTDISNIPNTSYLWNRKEIKSVRLARHELRISIFYAIKKNYEESASIEMPDFLPLINSFVIVFKLWRFRTETVSFE